MPPTLVVANAPYRLFHGGVIALRCSDWMAGARGTLSSEVDTRASSGSAVRDSQTVTNSIFSAATAAFQEADDTLVIDFSSLPLEPDLTYAVFVSYLIEGDWDTSNSDTYRSATQARFNSACTLAWYGDSTFFLSDTDRAHLKNPVRARPSYTMGSFPGSVQIGDVVGNETLYWRAYAQSGTTIEWLLDEIVLLPYVVSGVHNGWAPRDFGVVAGSLSDWGTQIVEDGTDGGDDNGQFTWHAYPENEETEWAGDDGGGDFQRKASYASAEYMIHVLPDFDAIYLVNTEPTPDEEAPGHAYSLHGVRYRETQTFTTDDFSRVVGGNSWGATADGYGYGMHIGTGGAASTDGSVGIHTLAGPANAASVGSILSGTTTTAKIAAANLTLSGEVTVTGMTIGSDPDRRARLKIGFRRPTDTGADMLWHIYIDLLDESWTLARTGNTSFSSPVDISGWYAQDSPIGFKVEILRYLMRAKVWDATGAEPGAWDVEEFRPMFSGLPTGTWYDYPYVSAPTLLHSNAGALLSPGVVSDNRDIGSSWSTHWDNFSVDYDPYGTAADMSAAIEQPHEGSKIGEIVVPYGSDYFVYWGSRDWTDFDSFLDGPYLDFSGRVWNDTGAAELQRAEAPFWYFRAMRDVIIPMNWRSSTREGGWKRVLKGG